MNEQLFLQKIKEAIVSKEVVVEPDTFQPIMKVVLEIPLDVKVDVGCNLSKETMYQLIGKAIFENETLE